MLKSYPGLLILVSHDKRFRESTTLFHITFKIKPSLTHDAAPRSHADEMMVLENKITRYSVNYRKNPLQN